MVVFNRKGPNQNLSKEIMNQTLEFFYCVQPPRNPSHKALFDGKNPQQVGRSLIQMVLV